MKKIAVVLSGCGNKDGAEITEAVSLIVALSELGAEIEYFAPNQSFIATNFLNGEKQGERNIMTEAARITRSQMRDLKELSSKKFDGLAIPGGFGAAMHLSNWSEKGAQCEVNPHLKKAIQDFYNESKPIACICIAPTIVARVLGEKGISLTIGQDPQTAKEIEITGAKHVECPVDDYITDREHKIVSTPAYMYGNARPHQVFTGIRGLAREFMEIA